jgi:hypothetical protein
LFVIACLDTHSHTTNAQVQLIVQALRQQDNDKPAAYNNTIFQQAIEQMNHPDYGRQNPLQELPIRSPQELSNESGFYPELPGNQKFLVELPPS